VLQQKGLRTVSPEEAKQLMDSGNWVLLDVRCAWACVGGCILSFHIGSTLDATLSASFPSAMLVVCLYLSMNVLGVWWCEGCVHCMQVCRLECGHSWHYILPNVARPTRWQGVCICGQ
jgi:hypothetical protein